LLMPSTSLSMRSKVKLLAALESKNGKAWIALYENNAFRVPEYYCTMHNNGQHLGNDIRQAAEMVMRLAADIKPRVYKLDLTPDVINRFL